MALVSFFVRFRLLAGLGPDVHPDRGCHVPHLQTEDQDEEAERGLKDRILQLLQNFGQRE